MTDGTNRKLDVENTDKNRISRDDPLFELSQIIGYSEEKGSTPDQPADEGQMDLEAALLRELEDFPGSVEEDLSEPANDVEVTPEPAAPAQAVVAPDAPVSHEFEPEKHEAGSLDALDRPEDDMPDTLEAELKELLGGLNDPAGGEQPAQAPQAPQAAAEEAAGLASLQVPAAPPVWWEPEGREEPASVDPAQADDSEILDEFESALSEGFALSFEEEANEAERASAAEAPVADDTAQPFEFSLDPEELRGESAGYEVDTTYANDHVESPYLNEVEAAADEIAADTTPQIPPVLDTADMPASDIEAMQPLDLPELPVVEEQGPAAVDIERELDAALSGYDNYDTIHQDSEPEMQAAAVAAGVADSRLDFDMGAFEDDLARDLEYVGHDVAAREGEAGYDDTGDAGDGLAIADNRKPKRGLMIAAAVGGIAILGTIAAFGLTSGDGGGESAPVLVRADPEPTKIVPDDPGGKEVPNQDRAVYGEVDGNGETAPTQETLVSTSEEPIDLGGAPALPSAMTETAKVEDRLTPDVGEAAATAVSQNGTAGLAPRRVRTVIVKPDGTLIENVEQPLAPPPAMASGSTPASAPDGGSVTETAAESVRRIEMAANAPQAREAVSESAAAVPSPAEDASTPARQTEAATTEQLAALAEPDAADAETAEVPEETVVARQPLRAPSSIPERPNDQPVTIVGTEPQVTRQVAEVAPSAPSQGAAVQPQPTPAQQAIPAGAYTVQIASQPSAELAQQSAADLERRYAGIIGGRSVAIQQAEIEGRGTYHRVRIVANNRQDAVAVCERIKQEGGSCFVAR